MQPSLKAVPVRRGIIEVLPNDRKSASYYTAEDVMKLLGVGPAKAYRMIRSLRLELIESGKIMDGYPAGKIPKKYFNKRCGIDLEV